MDGNIIPYHPQYVDGQRDGQDSWRSIMSRRWGKDSVRCVGLQNWFQLRFARIHVVSFLKNKYIYIYTYIIEIDHEIEKERSNVNAVSCMECPPIKLLKGRSSSELICYHSCHVCLFLEHLA